MGAVLGIGLALPISTSVGVATVTGVAEGVSHQRKVNEEMNNDSRQLKFHIDVAVEGTKTHSVGVDGGIVIMKGDKVWIEQKNSTTRQPADPGSHPFTGFYLNYPDDEREMTRGLVSTISKDPPILNWLYVDKDTLEVKYANRSGSRAHLVGDWDWTEEQGPNSNLTFDGWEGFVVLEEAKGKWALYFDVNDDGLKSKKGDRKSLEVSLNRRVISEQEVNKWGLGTEGNLGMKKTVRDTL